MKILNKQEFAYDVSGITGFTDNGAELIAKSLVGGTTVKYATLKTGLKGTQNVHILDSDPVFQAGGCGWSPTGTTSFDPVPITVCSESLQEALCPADLYDTYQSMMLRAGSPEETVPFLDQIAQLKVDQIKQRIEKQLWQATKTGGTCFDGLIEVISDVAAEYTGYTSFDNSKSYGTAGNPITEVDNMINLLGDDAAAREDLVVWMSFSNFRKYVQALTAANFFTNYVGGANIHSQMEAVHPNTNIKVVATIGLNGSDAIFLGPSTWIMVGTDLMSDTDTLNIWYSKDNNELRIRADYKYGVAIVSFSDIDYWVWNGAV